MHALLFIVDGMEIIFSKWNNTFYPKIKRCIVNFITGTSVGNQHLLVMLINVNGALDRFYLKFILYSMDYFHFDGYPF